MKDSEHHTRFLVVCGVFLLSACTGTDVTSTLPATQPEITSTSLPTPSLIATSTPTATPQPTRTREPTSTLPPDIEPLVGENWGIYLVEPDGENLQRLTEAGRNYRYPQFSHDGAWVAFIEEGDEDSESLIVYRLDTQEAETLFEAGGEIADFAWAPDSEQIAVLIQADENVAYLTMFELESRTLKEQLEWDGKLNSISWSYDGKYLAFAGSEPAPNLTPSLSDRPKTEVYLFDTVDGQLTQLTTTGGLAFEPAWSSVEYALAYGEKITDRSSGSLQLIYPFEADKAPTEIAWIPDIGPLIWSPDGEQIAYGGATGASVINIHDGVSSGLVWGVSTFFPTDWSPDSRMVLVEVWCCGLFNTNIIDTEKLIYGDPYAGRTQLLGSKIEQNQFHLIESQWSPVEDLIVFSGYWYPGI